jgi:hypothetical protein
MKMKIPSRRALNRIGLHAQSIGKKSPGREPDLRIPKGQEKG